MTVLAEALLWSGRGAVLSLFAVFPAATNGAIEAPGQAGKVTEVKTYHLEDLDLRLSRRVCFEYDLYYDGVPSNLEEVVVAWLDAALNAGAVLAWLGFEGSFDFDHILTDDIARQIYAVRTAERLELALEDSKRASSEWATTTAHVRERMGF